MNYKQAIHYICFLFSCYYVYIMLLIWSKSWNYTYWLLLFLISIKFGPPKFLCPKSVYWCWKQPVSTPIYIYLGGTKNTSLPIYLRRIKYQSLPRIPMTQSSLIFDFDICSFQYSFYKCCCSWGGGGPERVLWAPLVGFRRESCKFCNFMHLNLSQMRFEWPWGDNFAWNYKFKLRSFACFEQISSNSTEIKITPCEDFETFKRANH